jgi:hypothetical protein
VREFAGVVLFAAALIWIVALATYDPERSGVVFQHRSPWRAGAFAGRVGAFLAELSFQLVSTRRT